jgi:hypothetical protein
MLQAHQTPAMATICRAILCLVNLYLGRPRSHSLSNSVRQRGRNRADPDGLPRQQTHG